MARGFPAPRTHSLRRCGRRLKQYRWQIAALAIVATCLSTAIVGVAMWWLLPLLGVSLPLVYCLLFGALISPTDPISVMGILKSIGAPKRLSGPLAMVVVGLMVGNGARARAMSDTTRRYVDMFWELLDEILNAVLFVLIGMEVIVIAFSAPLLLAIAAAILITLVARVLTVGAPVGVMSGFFRLPRGSWRVLTWGGLRGGISVALAFSLAPGPERDTVLALTYGVVVFSVLVQGLTVGRVARGVCEESREA